MYRNKRKLAIGIMFFCFTALCIIGWLTRGYEHYYSTGCILFTLIGSGFLRSSKIG